MPTQTPASADRNHAPRRGIFHHYGLTIVLMAIFVLTLIGQIGAGWLVYNDDQRDHNQPDVSLSAYLGTSHFWEALSENWESEFLQMGMFVLLTCWFYQKGSAASKDPDDANETDDDPRLHRSDPHAPWPVRRGGWILRLYANSLSVALLLMFVASFMVHVVASQHVYNGHQLAHGEPPVSIARHAFSHTFWFESFQNWQSEFLSIAAMVVLTVFLRQHNSAESKPVHTPTWEHEK